MYSKYFQLFILLIFFSSCDKYASEVEKIKAENDKLSKSLSGVEDSEKILRGEYSEAIDVLNAIDDTLSNISDREKQIKQLNAKMELAENKSQKEQILSKLQTLRDANKNAQQQTKALQGMLQKFKGENETLRKMIDQAEARVKTIDEELGTKRNMVGEMQSTLKKTEKELETNRSDLAIAYEDLKVKNEKLQVANDKLQTSIAELKVKNDFIGKEALGYVCCGTKKFLRQKDILSATTMKLTKGFQSPAQANSSRINYFENNSISCNGSSKIVAVLPERDPSSYQIEGAKLIIRNTQTFWRTDKIVILVQE